MPLLSVRNLSKTFTMHLRDGVVLPVIERASFDVEAGECVVLGGPSGAGKSSILKMVYGNYGADAGEGVNAEQAVGVGIIGAVDGVEPAAAVVGDSAAEGLVSGVGDGVGNDA